MDFFCGKIFIKFIILTISKCTIQWHLVHSECWVTITTQNILIIQKRKPYAH